MECFNCGQDDHFARDCRWTPAALDAPMPRQCDRCPRCNVVVYAWDTHVPCEDHRTVTEWRAYYHSDQFVTDCAETRHRLEEHKRRGPRDNRVLAAEQVREARAARSISGLSRVSRMIWGNFPAPPCTRRIQHVS